MIYEKSVSQSAILMIKNLKSRTRWTVHRISKIILARYVYRLTHTRTQAPTLVSIVLAGRCTFPVLWSSWWTLASSNKFGGTPRRTSWPSGSATGTTAATGRRPRGTWSVTTWDRTSSRRRYARAAAKAWGPWAAWWAALRRRSRTWARS